MAEVEGSDSQSGEGTEGEEPSLDTLDKQHSLWVRWTDVDTTELVTEFDGAPIGDIHLHRYCDIIPTGRKSNRKTKEPDFKFVGDGDTTFGFGLVRTGLRFTPTIILLVTIGLVAYGELSPNVDGVVSLVPSVPDDVFVWLVGGLVLWLAILILAKRINLIDYWDVVKAMVVFGLIGVLLAGSVYSVYIVTITPAPSTLPPNVVFVSGYLLVMLLGGLLIYDGMLKTEFMIDNFAEWEHSIVPEESKSAYNDWKNDLIEDLTNSVCGIPTTYIIALLLISQFGFIWWTHQGPQGPQELNSQVTLLLNLFIDFFNVVVAFHFLILVKYMHELLSDSYVPKNIDEETADDRVDEKVDRDSTDEETGGKKILKYEPFHIDRRGGFKDLGRFATRVNVLLVLAGVYVVFRLYVQGLRGLPPAGITGFETELELVLWVGSYILPIAAYAIAAVAWFYYSFWAMHRKMVLDKQTLCMNTQGIRSGDEPMPAVGDPIEDFPDGPDWYYLNTAPEWPINSRWLVSLASANVAPLLVPFLSYFT